ncbi:hypothetical protein ES703_95409 [subsurface metagenome]
MWAALIWVGKVAWTVVKWAALKPLFVVAAGVTLVAAAQWLRAQPWAGSNVIADLSNTIGGALIVLGLGAFVVRGILAAVAAAKVRIVGTIAYVGIVSFALAILGAPFGSPQLVFGVK